MLGLYVHIPFCSKKCYYCDFASYVNNDDKIYDYIDAVLSELRSYKDNKFDTIFIGGGTPSYLNEDQLFKLLGGIANLISIDRIKEFTIECNPGTLTYEKLRVMKDFGVDRLSIGLQSANEETLKFIGRNHKFEDFDRSINLAHKVGITNINADLIFGIPNEGFEDYKNTLNVISSYDLNHISSYNLILEKNTKFYNLYVNGKLNEIDEDLQVYMYNYTREYLHDLGFIQYEVSNYAKEGKECLHNLVYWNFDDYIGVGVSAHSFYRNYRFENTRTLDKYIKMYKENMHIYDSVHKNLLSDNVEEYIMVGLRKNSGISLDKFYNRFGLHIDDVFKDQINKHILNGLLCRENDNLFLTERGFLLMNFILEDFLRKI